MEQDRFDVIVIGAGYGGVTSGALLAHRGLRVLILDKNDRPGGKAMTVRNDGYGYELWPIAGGPAEPSRFHDLVETLGLSEQVELIVPEDGGQFRYRLPDGSWATVPFSSRPASDPAAATRLPEALGASPEDTANMMNLVLTVVGTDDQQLGELESVDAKSWVRSFAVGRGLESYLFALLNLLFVVAVDRLPASEAVRTLRDFFQGGGGRYHARGFAHPAEALVHYVEDHGGEFRSLTRVQRVLVEDGRAVGVETSIGRVHADAVVSNAGIQPTVLKLTDTSAFPPEYVRRVRELEPSWAFVGHRYVVDTPIFDTPLLLQFSDDSWWDRERFRQAEAGDWPEDPLFFVVVPALYDPSLGAEGGQVALAGTMCSPDPHSPMNRTAIEQVDAAMHRTWPALSQHLVRREPFTAKHVAAASRDAVVPGQGGECIGLAQVFGQCGVDKPDVRSPLAGLYFTGCDAGGYGCGTHQAVESGFVTADAVAADLEQVATAGTGR